MIDLTGIIISFRALKPRGCLLLFNYSSHAHVSQASASKFLLKSFCGEEKKCSSSRIGKFADKETNRGAEVGNRQQGGESQQVPAHAGTAERDRAEGRPGRRPGAEEGE